MKNLCYVNVHLSKCYTYNIMEENFAKVKEGGEDTVRTFRNFRSSNRPGFDLNDCFNRTLDVLVSKINGRFESISSCPRETTATLRECSLSDVRKSQCPVRMTNCTLKRSLKAVPTHTRNRPNPKALLWMTNRCSRCLDEMRSSLGLICLLVARPDRLAEASEKERFSKETSDLPTLSPVLLPKIETLPSCTYGNIA